MCEPSRLASLYRAVIEQCLGVTALWAEDDHALVFTHDEITYYLHNTAPDGPGLLDLAVYLPIDESREIKAEACRQVALSLPCLKAWVDDEGNIVLKVQSLTGPIAMMPSLGVVKDLLPQAMRILSCAITYVFEGVVIAGILSVSPDFEQPSPSAVPADNLSPGQ